MDQFDIRRRRLDRRRALADALAGAAMQPSYYQSQLIPGPYGYKVAGAPALAAGIEKAGYLLGSALAGRGADEEERRLHDEQMAATQAWAGRFLSPTNQGSAPPNALEGAQGTRMPVERPRTKAEQIGLALEGLGIGGPGAMLAGSYLQGALKAPEYKRVEGFDPNTGRKTYLNYDASTGQTTPTGEIEAPPAPRISMNPKDFTPESWSKYEQTGQISALSPSTAEAEARLAEIAARAEEERRTRQMPSVSISYSRADPASLQLQRDRLEWEKSSGATSPDGKPMKPEKPTEGNLAAKGYLDRMSAAEQIMSGEELAGSQKPGAFEFAARAAGLETLANVASRSDRQRVRQAQEDWVRAKLRKESGAVIPNDEMEREIRVYFPQFGDKPDVIKQKASSRRQAEEQLRTMSGPAADRPQSRPLETGRSATGKILRFNPATGMLE